MQDKWKAGKKKGYLKSCSCKYKDQRNLALELQMRRCNDGKVMKQLIEQVLNNNHNIKIKSFIGDAGAYDNMRISNI